MKYTKDHHVFLYIYCFLLILKHMSYIFVLKPPNNTCTILKIKYMPSLLIINVFKTITGKSRCVK